MRVPPVAQLSRYTCRATRVAADFLNFIVFCRCSTGVALHPLKILVSHHLPPPPGAGRCRTEIWWSEKVSRYTGVSQLQLRVSRYTVQLSGELAQPQPHNWKRVKLNQRDLKETLPFSRKEPLKSDQNPQNSPDRGQSRKIRFSKFPGSGLKKFSELCVLLFFLGKIDKMFPKSRFSRRIFGNSAGSPKLDRPHCKQC